MPSSEESTNNSLILNDDDDKKHKSESLEYVENTRRNSNEIRKNVKSSGNEVTNADSEIEIYTDVESADRSPIANADANTPRSDPTTGANPGIESGVNDSSNHDSFSDTNNANSDSPEGDGPENKSANKNNSLEETGDRYIKTMRRDNQGRSLDQESDNISSQKKFMSGSEGSSESLESEINICISDAKLEDLQQKKSLKERMKKWLGYHRRMSQREFKKQIQILYKCCLKSVRDLHELHLRRTAGLEILDDLILRARPSYLTIAHVIHITWSIMSCLHHFQLRLRTVSLGPVAWTRRRTAEHCMTSYSKLIRIFRPEMHRIILNAILTFYREGKLWQIEFACRELIVELLEIYKYAEEGIEDMLYTIETSTLVNVHEAKYIVQVLYEVLKKINWKRMSEYLMRKFLSMLESSIIPKPTDKYNYCPLRKGLEICLINITGNLNIRDLMKLLYLILKKMKTEHFDEEMLLCFGNVATYAAKKYRIKTLRTTILKGPLPLIFSLFKFKNPLLMLLATRIWQNLIDRNNNNKTFLTPKIFFQDCNYALNMKKCKDEDKAFFKSVRHLVYQISLNDFLNSQGRMGIENSYQAVALTLVEIPCGYTASCFITVAMSLQEYAFSITKDDLVRSHHLHATILSLLTLICYIHNATVFYDYVNTVMERRAEWAPHLNPPLKSHYEYAQHHILWNKPELFFEDWEARYGLWKCFRVKKKPLQLQRPQ